MGQSSTTRFSPTSCRTTVATYVFVTLPTRNRALGVMSAPVAMSAVPAVADGTAPPASTRTTTPGTPAATAASTAALTAGETGATEDTAADALPVTTVPATSEVASMTSTARAGRNESRRATEKGMTVSMNGDAADGRVLPRSPAWAAIRRLSPGGATGAADATSGRRGTRRRAL